MSPQLIMSDASQMSASQWLGAQHQQAPRANNLTGDANSPAKQTRVAKVRRTRRARNPQLSVARRNERERNRVKMVNNGFAVLRDHLPAEYLALMGGPQRRDTESGCDTPDVSSVGGDAKSPCPSSSGGQCKSKKFSKVETLRAAIKHIKMLHKILKESDPSFELAAVQQQQQQQQQAMGAGGANSPVYVSDVTDGPLSAGGASHSHSHEQQQQQQQQQMSFQVQYLAQPTHGEQFVKLEPTQAHPAAVGQCHQQLSPFETGQTTIVTTDTVNSPPTTASPYDQQASPAISGAQEPQPQHQQQHNHRHHHHLHQDDSQMASEHTHLWIRQHQSSFIEQQQQYNWAPYQQQQQQQQQHFAQDAHHQHQQLSPADSQTGSSPGYLGQQQQQHQDQMQFRHHAHQQHHPSGQQQQLDSPPAHWFTPSPTSQRILEQQVAGAGALGSHLQNQISLYSQ